MRGKRIKILSVMGILALLLLQPAGAYAQSSSGSGSCSFDGSRITSDFETGKIAKAVTDLQPGDDVSFTVSYTNSYSEDTDWYLENEVVQTLEKASAARKKGSSDGTGTPENGGYTYELIHTDKNGNSETLFGNREVGGDAKPGGLQGLEQATNATQEWFYLETLGSGESGKVTLKVEFEGETEVNDYMDTEGGLELRFAAEIVPKGSAAAKEKTDRSEKSSKSPGKSAKTGDSAKLSPWALAMLVSGLVLLILAVRNMRRERKQAMEGEGPEGGGRE